MKEKKKAAVYPNVDLYSASLYYSMEIPMDLNTPIFAMARAAGWSAHIIEEKLSQAAKSVLYRPKADYMGKKCGTMGCEYVPIKNRNQDFKPCPSYE
jgi:citrate synthase